MIIDAKTVVITFAIIGVALYFGLGAIRSFALSIAQENHDANLALDMTEEARRAKRERDADAAATAAFAKVEPLLPASIGASLPSVTGAAAAASPQSNLSSRASSTTSLNAEEATDGGDEEASGAASSGIKVADI